MVLNAPIVFDTKYGYRDKEIKSRKLFKVIDKFRDSFHEYTFLIIRQVKEAYSELDESKLLQDLFLNSLKTENSCICLHSLSLKFTIDREVDLKALQVDESYRKEMTHLESYQEEELNLMRTVSDHIDVTARMGLQMRLFLKALGVKEKDVYQDALK